MDLHFRPMSHSYTSLNGHDNQNDDNERYSFLQEFVSCFEYPKQSFRPAAPPITYFNEGCSTECDDFPRGLWMGDCWPDMCIYGHEGREFYQDQNCQCMEPSHLHFTEACDNSVAMKSFPPGLCQYGDRSSHCPNEEIIDPFNKIVHEYCEFSGISECGCLTHEPNVIRCNTPSFSECLNERWGSSRIVPWQPEPSGSHLGSFRNVMHLEHDTERNKRHLTYTHSDVLLEGLGEKTNNNSMESKKFFARSNGFSPVPRTQWTIPQSYPAVEKIQETYYHSNDYKKPDLFPNKTFGEENKCIFSFSGQTEIDTKDNTGDRELELEEKFRSTYLVNPHEIIIRYFDKQLNKPSDISAVSEGVMEETTSTTSQDMVADKVICDLTEKNAVYIWKDHTHSPENCQFSKVNSQTTNIDLSPLVREISSQTNDVLTKTLSPLNKSELVHFSDICTKSTVVEVSSDEMINSKKAKPPREWRKSRLLDLSPAKSLANKIQSKMRHIWQLLKRYDPDRNCKRSGLSTAAHQKKQKICKENEIPSLKRQLNCNDETNIAVESITGQNKNSDYWFLDKFTSTTIEDDIDLNPSLNNSGSPYKTLDSLLQKALLYPERIRLDSTKRNHMINTPAAALTRSASDSVRAKKKRSHLTITATKDATMTQVIGIEESVPEEMQLLQESFKAIINSTNEPLDFNVPPIVIETSDLGMCNIGEPTGLLDFAEEVTINYRNS